MKQTILLITLLVSTLGVASEIKSPEETGAGVSIAEIELIESMKQNESSRDKATLEKLLELLKFNKCPAYYKRCDNDFLYSKSLFELSEDDKTELKKFPVKNYFQDNRKYLLPEQEVPQK